MQKDWKYQGGSYQTEQGYWHHHRDWNRAEAIDPHEGDDRYTNRDRPARIGTQNCIDGPHQKRFYSEIVEPLHQKGLPKYFEQSSQNIELRWAVIGIEVPMRNLSCGNTHRCGQRKSF